MIYQLKDYQIKSNEALKDYDRLAIKHIDANQISSRIITFKADRFSNFAIATKGEGSSTPIAKTYIVTFDKDGFYSEVEVKEGKTIEEPLPTKEGYVFTGWYESGAESRFDFSKPITRDVNLLATWDKAVSIKPVENESSNNKAAREATSEVIVCLQQGLASEEVVEELDPVVAAAIVDARDNNKEITVDLTTDTITEDDLDQATIDKINETVKEDEVILGYFDIDLNVLVDGQEVGKLTRLENPIKITVDAKDLIKDLPKEESGYTRTYVVIRLHNGETDIIPATLNADGTIDFVTDRFSTYTIAYTDIKNPKTGDSIIYFIVMLGVSILGLISTLIYKKCFVKIEK